MPDIDWTLSAIGNSREESSVRPYVRLTPADSSAVKPKQLLALPALALGLTATPAIPATAVVTDAPLDSATATRVAARVGLGLARCGSVAHHGSGEIFCCLATGLRAPRGATSDRAAWPSSRLDDLFEATVDATESAVWDSILSATTTTGRRGLTVPALPRDRLEALLGAT